MAIKELFQCSILQDQFPNVSWHFYWYLRKKASVYLTAVGGFYLNHRTTQEYATICLNVVGCTVRCFYRVLEDHSIFICIAIYASTENRIRAHMIVWTLYLQVNNELAADHVTSCSKIDYSCVTRKPSPQPHRSAGLLNRRIVYSSVTLNSLRGRRIQLPQQVLTTVNQLHSAYSESVRGSQVIQLRAYIQ